MSPSDSTSYAIETRYSYRYWAMEYLNIDWYTSSASPAPIDHDTMRTTGRLMFKNGGASIKDRGLMGCPSAGGHANTRGESDFWAIGFGGGCSGYANWPAGERRDQYYYMRMSRLESPANGSPKIMFGDNTWNDPTPSNMSVPYNVWNNHNPGDPKGMNYIIGDGSGKWAPIEDLRQIYSYTGTKVIPKNVYAAAGIWLLSNSADRILHAVANADGTTTQHKKYTITDPIPAAMQGWINEFY